jgi:hypothetical protein
MDREEQIQQLTDELEIRNLLARLAQTADEADLDDYSLLYTEDAIWDGGATFGVLRGLEEIRSAAGERRASGTTGPGSHTRHIVTTTSVRIEVLLPVPRRLRQSPDRTRRRRLQR